MYININIYIYIYIYINIYYHYTLLFIFLHFLIKSILYSVIDNYYPHIEIQ